MLFPYPPAAAAENWLHECLTDTLRRGMNKLDAGLPLDPWPDCVAPDRRERLRKFTSLEEKLSALLGSYEALDIASRAAVQQAFDDQSALHDLFDGRRPAQKLNDLPEPARKPAKLFFEKAFEMLTPLGIRDANYRTLLRLIEHRICPFCGCEYFSGPSSRRMPLDHYLAISLYPFAGANARNLVTMGPRCNSSYKLSQDVLRDRAGVRRVCFDPYAATPVRVSLLGSRLFAREDGLPDWKVDFEGDVARIETWDEVFEIKKRLSDDHLDSIYKNSLKLFGMLWRKKPEILNVSSSVCDIFSHLADLSRAKGLSDRDFLYTALFELLQARCAAGGTEAERIVAEFADAALALA